MGNGTMDIVVAAYATEDGAKAALTDFQAAERAGAINLVDAAVVVHTAEGKVRFEETADPSGRRWAKRGAIAGGVVGLIFPPSIIASAAVGKGDLVDVVTAISAAEMSLETLVAVRDQAIGAYQEVMRMNI